MIYGVKPHFPSGKRGVNPTNRLRFAGAGGKMKELILIPIIGATAIMLIPTRHSARVREVSLLVSIAALVQTI